MAEAAAAFYAIETVVEGAAVGAYAVSQSTTPLHLRFRPIPANKSSSEWKGTIAHSVNVVKGKAYIFGGDSTKGNGDNLMRIITLPSDIANGEPDYETVVPDFEADRPLQQYSSATTSISKADASGFEQATISGHEKQNTTSNEIATRSSHASTSISPNIFILAGRTPQALEERQPLTGSEDARYFDCDQVCAFSTQTNKWSIIQADISKCKDGIPASRTGASCTSSPHPQPDSAVDVTARSHGTIFLHGGYDIHGQPLRDTWAFDVNSRVWSQWPDLPRPLAEEVPGEGRITCVNKQLWRAGDGFGKMLYIDFDVLRGDVVDQTSGPHPGETSIKPVSGRWNALTFGEKAANTVLAGETGGEPQKSVVENAKNLPVPRQGAGFVPVELGAGRNFLLYFMGQDGPGSILGDVWSFQIEAEDKTPAAVKDSVRDAAGRSTGKHQWAPCDIIESTKDEGQVYPPRGLTAFAADSWRDLGGGNVVLWGGIDANRLPTAQGWVLSVE